MAAYTSDVRDIVKHVSTVSVLFRLLDASLFATLSG